MWGWVVQNKEWVFSGAGLTALGVLWWLITKFWPKREIAAPAITQEPSTSIAPSIVMNPTINIDSRAPEPAKPVTPSVPTLVAPKAKPNLCNEAVKISKIWLEGDIWTLRPNIVRGQSRPYRALLADISNVPTDEAHTARAAIRAAIRIGDGSVPLTYSPLPWLEEFTNKVYLDIGARKTVVLAVGEDKQMGAWSFVLNQREEYHSYGASSAMDWTNQCPTPSGAKFEILMVDMNSGALLTKFVYRWTFDSTLNYPILKPFS